MVSIKEYWHNLKFWQKGIVVGALLFPLFNGGNYLAYLFYIFGINIDVIPYYVILFIFEIFVRFGFGFMLVEYFESYVIRGAFIGAWLAIVPLVFRILAKIILKGEGGELFFFVATIGMYIFIGAMIGLFYEARKNKESVKVHHHEKKEKIIGRIEGFWTNLRFWQKGVIGGVIFYFLAIAPLILFNWDNYSGIKEFLQAIVIFFAVTFGMFGLGFKIAEFVKRYYVRGFIIGLWLAIIPLIVAIVSPTGGTESSAAKGYAIILLLFLMPILGLFGGFIGYLYEKIRGGEMNNSINKLKEIWNNLKFWQKGVIIGALYFVIRTIIIYALFGTPPAKFCAGPCTEFHLTLYREDAYKMIGSYGLIIVNSIGLKENFLLGAILNFLIISFGTFGAGFKLAGFSKKYYEKGFIFGLWFLVIPIIFFVANGIRQPSYGEHTGGLAVFVLIAAVPFLALLCALMGYVYGKIRGDNSEK